MPDDSRAHSRWRAPRERRTGRGPSANQWREILYVKQRAYASSGDSSGHPTRGTGSPCMPPTGEPWHASRAPIPRSARGRVVSIAGPRGHAVRRASFGPVDSGLRVIAIGDTQSTAGRGIARRRRRRARAWAPPGADCGRVLGFELRGSTFAGSGTVAGAPRGGYVRRGRHADRTAGPGWRNSSAHSGSCSSEA